MDRKKEILDMLECAYSGAKMNDDFETMCRLSRAIIAFSYDDIFATPTWEQMMESYTMTGHSINDKCNCIYAEDGDIYLNPFFGDLWVVDGKSFIKINNGYSVDIDEPEGFIKVGHINGVINKRMKG